MVGDEMMDVMAALPPAEGKTAAEVGDEQADERVYGKDVGDGEVSGIMCGEHELVLHTERQWMSGVSECARRTQKRPRKAAEVMYQPWRRATALTTNRLTYRASSLPYSDMWQW